MEKIKEIHLTYPALAEEFEVDPNTVWRWASGRQMPSLVTARRLAKKFNSTVDELFSESNPTLPPAGSVVRQEGEKEV